MRVVAYYTEAYRGEAELLQASLDAVGVDYTVEWVQAQGDWDANTAIKPIFLARCRERFNGPLLYVDVDAFFHADPSDYFQRLAWEGYDFGVHWFAGPSYGHNRTKVCACVRGEPCSKPSHWLLSGTLYLGDTTGCREILASWIALNAARRAEGYHDGGGQRNLWAILNRNQTWKVKALPGRFTYVFDKPWAYPEDEPCIIEHTIASRDHRGSSARDRPRRYHRKQELWGKL